MNHDSEEVNIQSQRVSNTSCAEVSPGEAITNENKPAEQESSEKESPRGQNEKNKPEPENKDVSEQKVITKDENNQALRKASMQETLEHNDNNASTEPKNNKEILSCGYGVVDVENDDNNVIVDEERELKRAACCGCLVDVCYCMTWYCEIMRNFIVRCFNNLFHLCGRNRNNTSEESEGNYFYSGLNDTFNNQSDGVHVGNIVMADEATATIANDRSVPNGNDGGYDNCAVDKLGDTDGADSCGNLKSDI